MLVLPGDVVAVRVGGIVHEGIATDVLRDGAPTVVHKSRRRMKVTEESWREFCQRRPAWVVGYPGERCPCCVLADARSRMGEPWQIHANCQHFVRECHGLPRESPGLRGAGLLIVGVGSIVAVTTLV